jgi:hypothetical protein
VIHRLQFRRGPWQKANLNTQLRRTPLTVCRGVWRTAIFKQDNVPTTPMRSNHVQKIDQLDEWRGAFELTEEQVREPGQVRR